MKNTKLMIAAFAVMFSMTSQDAIAQNKVDKVTKIVSKTPKVKKVAVAKKSLQKPVKKSIPSKKLNDGNVNRTARNKNLGRKSTTGKLSKNSGFTKTQKKQLEINRGLAARRGSYTLPFKSTRREADRLGKSFVGPNYELLKDGKGYLSKDGLKMYRKPAYKKEWKRERANFQRGVKNPETGKTKWVSNAHLDLKD